MKTNINGKVKETSLEMDYALKSLINGAVDLGVIDAFQAVEAWNHAGSINKFTDDIIYAAWMQRMTGNGQKIHSEILNLSKRITEELRK